jgi:hypothetical protein
MRFFDPTNRVHRSVGAVVLAAAIVAAGTPASAATSPAPTAAALQAWQTKMSQVPQPSKGCFTSTYPSLVWQQLPCGFADNPPVTPKPPGPRPRSWPLDVGNTNGDLTAVAPSGHISSATGSFDTVSVTSESSSGVSNNYTLQLNTNPFASPTCAGNGNPVPADCQGWEQFVYWNSGSAGRLFIQYWLLHYDAPCPAGGWTFFEFNPGDTDTYCYRNNAGQLFGLANQPITNLINLRIVGNASAGSDSMTFFVGGVGTTIPGDNSVAASTGWTTAEYNVFGGPGGAHATFNSGASIKVRTLINYGGDLPPGCDTQSFTGETTNLGFGTPHPTPTAPGPSIQFIEDTAHSSAPDCAFAAAIGDTHQTTVAGLLYDFQASGDFVEAQVGPDFEVQTRKVSGAPTWPDASVNRSVGARMGKTEVALCDGQELVIDGKPVPLEDGKSLWIPPGVDIGRTGNTYVMIDEHGNSVQATQNPGYLDVSVGLGAYPVKVRGLLGNPDGDVKRLEASDGTQFSVPVSFTDLYDKYGESWRLDPGKSLLSVCGEKTEQGNPEKPFFARDLDPKLREQAMAICLRAGVSQQWLDACTLDVAVLGDKAAARYVGAAAPVLTNP